jgi:hypothetical protein
MERVPQPTAGKDGSFDRTTGAPYGTRCNPVPLFVCEQLQSLLFWSLPVEQLGATAYCLLSLLIPPLGVPGPYGGGLSYGGAPARTRRPCLVLRSYAGGCGLTRQPAVQKAVPSRVGGSWGEAAARVSLTRQELVQMRCYVPTWFEKK